MTLFLDVFKVLWPSYAVFWIISICLAAGFWFALTKLYSQIKFKPLTPVLFGTFLTCFAYANTFLGIYNSQLMYTAQQEQQKSQGADKQAQSQMDPVLKAKSEFLSKVEGVIQSGSVTKEVKAKLLKEFAQAFTDKSQRDTAVSSIKKVFSCQRILWEDALASYKAKQVIKSDSRIACEKASGDFFNREKLFTEDTLKAHTQIIKNIAERRRIPASDGKETELSEDMVRNEMEAQSNALKVLNQIFE